MARVRLYAVVRGLRRSPLPRGLKGEALRVVIVRAARVAAVRVIVGDAHGTLAPTEKNLRAHHQLMTRLAARVDAMLPARFESVAPSDAALRAEIADRAAMLVSALDLVAGRVQMTLRVPAPPPSQMKLPRTAGRRYLAALAQASMLVLPSALREDLALLTRAERVEPDAGGVVAYHLIDKAHVRRYRKLAGAIATGPFPPYAFVPGIDPAVFTGDETQTRSASCVRPSRSRAHRRSA